MSLLRRPWRVAPHDLHLSSNEVHVWRALLAADASMVKSFWSALPGDERRRAEKFRFERDRLHFVISRGVLRDILSRYLQRAPAQIRFTYNKYGKPALADSSYGPRFNVSHSNGAALYAFSLQDAGASYHSSSRHGFITCGVGYF